MQKLTIFFIGATVVILGITGAFLGYKYIAKDSDEAVNLESEVMEEQKEVEVTPIPGEVVSEKEEPPTKLTPSGETDKPIVVDSDESFLVATLDIEKVMEAGFTNPDIEIKPFSGILFENINFNEFRDDEHVEYELSENTEHAGNLTELTFPSSEIADEIYQVLKGLIVEDNSFILNETNQYGEYSFFANHEVEKNSVFLVVKIGSRMYTFHYPAKNHNKFKNLIGLL